MTPTEALALHGAGGALIVATYPESSFRDFAYIAEAVSSDRFGELLPDLDRARGLIFY